MATAKNTLHYDGTYYEAEDVYRHSQTGEEYEIVAFMKIGAVDYVILKVTPYEQPAMLPMAEFAKLRSAYLKKVVKPKYEVGDCFIHPMSSREIKILAVSPEICSVNNTYSYFVEVVKANGKPFYNVMSETFLNKCIRDKF